MGSINLLAWLTELRDTFTYIYQFIIKGIIKDTDEEPEERDKGKVHEKRPRALMPSLYESTTLPTLAHIYQPEAQPCPLRLHYLDMIDRSLAVGN